MTLTQLYLFTVILPNISATFTFFAISLICLTVGALFIALLAASGDAEEKAPRFIALSKKAFIWLCVLSVVALPFPTEKQLYTLAGGYVATNAKDVSKLPDNVVKAANAWLEKAADLADNKTSKKSNE
jgi:hypothetical protein